MFSLILLLFLSLLADLRAIQFRESTSKLKLSQTTWSKYGGPIVADLDSDGRYDLILTYHKGRPYQVYHQQPDNTFKLNPFDDGGDIHGVSVAPATTNSSEKLVILSKGGRGGKIDRSPVVLRTFNDQSVDEVGMEVGFTEMFRRGRITLFMDLARVSSKKRKKRGGGWDVLVANYLGPRPVPEDVVNFGYENMNGKFVKKRVKGFEKEVQGRAMLTDVNGDGLMEVVCFQEWRIWRVVGAFELKEVSAQLWPGGSVEDYTVNAVVEIDFDNDGDFDLYLARGFQELASNKKNNLGGRLRFPDILLENRGGTFVDVTEKMGIQGNGRSLGASVGDFDNDGWTDIVVTGEETFVWKNMEGKGFERKIIDVGNGIGDNVLAVDLEQDGRVDFMVGMGGIDKDEMGKYVYMKNVLSVSNDRRWLHVRVGDDPKGGCTAIHAVVEVIIRGGGRMTRRVGWAGGQKEGSGGLLDTLHFGLGKKKQAKSIKVRWACGGRVQVKRPSAGDLIVVGKVNSR